MLINDIEGFEDESNSEQEPPKKGNSLFNSSSKFASGNNVQMIDQDTVLKTAKDMFKQQQLNKDNVNEDNKLHQDNQEDDSESATNSQDEMSFTSDENNTDALNILALCVDQEKKKQAALLKSAQSMADQK